MPSEPPPDDVLALRRRLAEWAKESMPAFHHWDTTAGPQVGLDEEGRWWLPDESKDDCEPLLKEVGRRGLISSFLRIISDSAGDLRLVDVAFKWHLVTLTPAQIIAAVSVLAAAEAAETPDA